jgi:NAD(P)-dependent dehydrogenase (short-subunit alcohol dehydrogenase family)
MWPYIQFICRISFSAREWTEFLGIKAKGYQSNAADFDEAQTMVDAVLADFGTVDILINNAGITKDNLCVCLRQILTKWLMSIWNLF